MALHSSLRAFKHCLQPDHTRSSAPNCTSVASTCSTSGQGHPCGVLLPRGTFDRYRDHARNVLVANDWSSGSYRAAGDWSVAYPDPRATPPGPPRQPYSPDPAATSPSASYDGDQSGQEADPLSDIVRSGVDVLRGFLGFVVGRISEGALAMLPQNVKRRAVENTIKGALTLLGLALLQSVLSFVLTVGTMVLAVYAANQVFGVHLPFVPLAGSGVGARAGQEGGGSSSGPAGTRGFSDGGYGPARPQGAYPHDPYQQGYSRYNPGYGGSGYAYGPPRQPGAAGPRGARPQGGARQGSVIDVYYESM